MDPHSLKDSLGAMSWIVNDAPKVVSGALAGRNPNINGRMVNPEYKKIGAESGDPNRHSQPRLPGSVVGKPSMRRTRFRDKITEVIVPK
jgi:hypothetical protein